MLPPKKPKSDPPPEADASPYAPRPAAEVPEQSALPPVKDIAELQRATADMIEFGIPLDEAAARYKVDMDTLHVYYRTYVKTYGKENIDTPGEFGGGHGEDFNRQSHRQFDRNWAEMNYQAERDRPQISALRKWLMNFPLTGWAFNGDTLDKVAVLGAVFVIGLGALAFALTRQDVEAPPSVLVEEKFVPAKIDELMGEDRGTEAQRDEYFERVATAISDYVTIESWEDRLPFVRGGTGLEEAMRSYYETNPDGAVGRVELKPEMIFIERDDGQFVLLAGNRKDDGVLGEPVIFFMEVTEGEGFLVDWEVLVNHEPVAWEEFQAAKSVEPARFRVKISLGDYYNQPFMDAEKFVSYRMTFLYRPELEVFGFVPKDSPMVETIANSMAANGSADTAMILNLRFPEEAKFDDIVEIESVVEPHW